jgi:TRAP-type C4-dicarboxylate transport system substrate-binding protein
MKKSLSVSMLLLLSAALLFAGGSSEKKAEGPKLVKEFKLGYINSPVGPMHEAALRFGELLREATKGQYSIKVYPSSQLGNERELTEAVTLGTVDMTLSGPTPVSWYIPEYSMVNCPFIYKDLKHYMRVWDGEVGKFINGLLLEKKGLVVLDNWYRGPRYLTAKKEIKTLDDLKGLKIRVPEAEITLEAQENPFEMIQTASLYDVQKFIMNTQHVASHYMLLIADKQLKGLPEDVQKAIRETAVKAGEYQDKLMIEGESKILKELEAKGMKFVEMDPKPWKELVLKQIPVKFASKYKMDIFEKILKTE